jgi:hypothetical protein
MAEAFVYASFKSTVFKRIDSVFPDRSVQLKELEKLAEVVGDQSSQNLPISPYEASTLVLFLRVLVDIQRRNAPPTVTTEVEVVMRRISAIYENASFNKLSKPVTDQIDSIVTQVSAHCICQLVYIIHMYIYRHSAHCTSLKEWNLN